MKTLPLVLFAAFSSAAQAATPTPATVISYETLHKATSGYVKTLGREVVLYNYLRSAGVYAEPDSGQMRGMITRLTNQYLNPKTQHEPSFKMGSGLYLASDPINGKRYTRGSAWNLMALSMLPQTRFIDLRGAAERPLPEGKGGNVIVESQGCANFECSEKRAVTCELTSLRTFFADMGEADCRALALRLTHELRIQLVGYNWDGLWVPPCAPKQLDPSINNTANLGFVLADTAAVDLSRSRYLSSTLPKKADSADLERQLVEEVARRAGMEGAEDPFPTLAKTITDAQFDEFVSRAQFGCQPAKYPQDAPIQ